MLCLLRVAAIEVQILLRAGPAGAALLLFLAAPAAAQSPPAEEAGRPLTLAAAIEIGVGASPQAAAAREGLRRAEAELARARAARWPQLFGSARYTRTLATEFDFLRDGPPPPPGPEACAPFAPDPTLPLAQQIARLAGTVECVAHTSPFVFGETFADLPFGRTNQYVFGLSASQPVFTGGRIDALARAAAAREEGAGILVAAARAQVVLDVAQAYYDAALADRLVAIAEASLGQADATLEQAGVSWRAGALAEFDVLRARVQRDNQRAAIVRRRADRDVAHLRLRHLLALPADQPLHLAPPAGDEPVRGMLRFVGLAEDVPDLEVDPALVEHRAPVRQARALVSAQEHLVQVAASQRLPQVTLSSSFARVAYPERFAGWDEFRTNWTVDVALQVPLFTAGRIGAERRVAEADLGEAQERLREARDLAALDTGRAQAELAAARAAWEASAGTAEQATRAVSLAQVRFREGLSTQLEVADTQLQLEQAEILRAQAARDLQVARIRAELLPYLPLGGDRGGIGDRGSGIGRD